MKRIIILFTAITCVAIFLLTSCNGKTGNENTETPECDTVPQTVEVDETTIPLPDTTYPSIANLKYDITIFDTITSGELSNIEDAYKESSGIFTFRGNPLRNAAFCGHIDSIPTDIDIDWTFVTEFDTVKTSFGQWGGGTGWTGQHLYV